MARLPLSQIDRFICHADNVLHTLIPGVAKARRANPAATVMADEMDENQRQFVAGLMRVNHTGEVCAQALYQGQALTAKLPDVRQAMEQAAQEEIDHLAWCEQRISELNSHTSVLNPAFYAMSFGIGAVAGLISDKISLGFVAATEDQVCKHLEDHLQQLPAGDRKTRAILEKMLEDESSHATKAIDAGGVLFPTPIKAVMTLMSKVMTATTFRV